MTVKFQQRHYEVLAQLIQDLAPLDRSKAETREEYRQRIIDSMCNVFAADNPHFNAHRFRVACQPGNPVRGNRRQGPAMPYVQPRN